MITHRLQDAFTLATHHFDEQAGKMLPIAHGVVDEKTSFLVLNEGKIVFQGSTLELTRSDDPWIKSYLA